MKMASGRTTYSKGLDAHGHLYRYCASMLEIGAWRFLIPDFRGTAGGVMISRERVWYYPQFTFNYSFLLGYASI